MTRGFPSCRRGDLERLPAPVSAAAPGAGPATVAAELVGRMRAELPVISELGEPEQLLVPAWLTGPALGWPGPRAT